MLFNATVWIYIAMLMVSSCYVFDRVGVRYAHARAYAATSLFILAGMVPVYFVVSWWGY